MTPTHNQSTPRAAGSASPGGPPDAGGAGILEQLQGGGVVPRQAHNLETPVQVRPLLPVPGEGDDAPAHHPPVDAVSSLAGGGAQPPPPDPFREDGLDPLRDLRPLLLTVSGLLVLVLAVAVIRMGVGG